VVFTKKIKLPHFTLKNLDGEWVTPDYFDAKLNILIFFSFKDCSSCLYEAEYWGEAPHVFSKSDVILSGITNETDRGALNEFSSEYRLSFPIILDENFSLRDKIVQISKDSRLNISTPFKVFVNRNHEIIYVEGPVKDVDSQRLFTDRISKILSNNKEDMETGT